MSVAKDKNARKEVSDTKNLIRIKGARANNLKNVSLDIPKNKLVVFTGLSGSGKSSLTMDTLFAEGQRRYVESLSSYARVFVFSSFSQYYNITHATLALETLYL